MDAKEHTKAMNIKRIVSQFCREQGYFSLKGGYMTLQMDTGKPDKKAEQFTTPKADGCKEETFLLDTFAKLSEEGRASLLQYLESLVQPEVQSGEEPDTTSIAGWLDEQARLHTEREGSIPTP